MNPVTKILIVVFFALANPSFGQFNRLWESHYNPVGYSSESARKVVTDTDGNAYVMGRADAMFSGTFIVKYDKSGATLWTCQLGYGFNASPGSYKLMLDGVGGVYVVSPYNPYGSINTSLVKINAQTGVAVWEKSLFTRGPIGIFGGNIYYVQATLTIGDPERITKCTLEGEMIWSKNLNVLTNSGRVNSYVDLLVASDKIIVWGYTKNGIETQKAMLLVLDKDGNAEWYDSFDFQGQMGRANLADVQGNLLFVDYYYNSPDLNRIVVYDLSTKSKVTDWGNGSKDPLISMFVGSDNAVYALGYNPNYELLLSKYALVSPNVYYPVGVGSKVPNPGYFLSFYPLATIPNKATNTLTLLLKSITGPTVTYKYSIVEFKPDLTNAELATLTTPKGPSEMVDFAIAQNNNFVVAGVFDTKTDYKKDLLVQGITRTGQKQWESTFVPGNTLTHIGRAIACDTDGSCYVVGNITTPQSTQNFAVVKYDPSGKPSWTKLIAPYGQLGITVSTVASPAIAINSQHEIVVTGIFEYSNSDGPAPLCVLKLDNQGNMLWNGTDNNTSPVMQARQVALDAQDNIYVLAHTRWSDPNTKMVVRKYSPSGTFLWEKKLAPSAYEPLTPGGEGDRPWMKIVKDKIYVVAHDNIPTDRSDGYSLEFWRIDMAGNQELNVTTICQYCYVTAVPLDFTVSDNGNLNILFSLRQRQTLLRAYSPSGAELWTTTGLTDFSPFGSVVEDQNGDFYVTSSTATTSSDTGTTLYAKVSSSGKILWTKQETGNRTKGLPDPWGDPAKVFLKSDGNPVFINTQYTSSDMQVTNLTERSPTTGDVLQSDVIPGDSPIDRSSPDGQFSHWLTAIYKVPDADQFYITGAVAGKFARTIQTIKYGVRSTLPTIPLKAAFAGARTIVEGMGVTYSDQSEGQPTRWQWTFEGGDLKYFDGQTPPTIVYTTPGKYGVALEVTRGTDSDWMVQQQYVEVLQKLKADFSVSRDTVQVGEPLNFTDLSQGPATDYTWTFDGADLSGSTIPSPQGITYSQPGTYEASLSISNALDSDKTSKKITVALVTGIEQSIPGIYIYPTVTTGPFKIDARQPIKSTYIFNAFGQIVKSRNAADSDFDISDLPTGLYLVVVKTLTGNASAKIIKQ